MNYCFSYTLTITVFWTVSGVSSSFFHFFQFLPAFSRFLPVSSTVPEETSFFRKKPNPESVHQHFCWVGGLMWIHQAYPRLITKTSDRSRTPDFYFSSPPS